MADSKRLMLKQLRVQHGDMSQQAMADTLGVERQLYSKIELGQRRGSVDFWRSVQARFGLDDATIWQMEKEGM